MKERYKIMYDVIIIGAGPAGVSAGLYTKRANLNVLILYKDQSALEKTEWIENYYGFEKGISGEDLYRIGIQQAKNLGIDVKQEEVTNIQFGENNQYIVMTEKEIYKTKTVIFATGNKKNTPKIKGIKEFEGKGVSYCAVCDGFFYRNKDVSILGNGKYAISEANELINIANSITILTDGKEAPDIRADNVKIDTRRIQEVRGDNKVEEVEFDDNSITKTDGIFVALGVAGGNEFARKLGMITQKDRIVVNENMETNIPGIYACGDCVGGLLQISKSVYEGTKAGLQAIQYIREENA